MPPRVSLSGDQEDKSREFSNEHRMFVCELKMEGKKYPIIRRRFTAKYGTDTAPPSRQCCNKLVCNLNVNFTVKDCRKGIVGRKITVRTPRRSLERAASRTPGQQVQLQQLHHEGLEAQAVQNPQDAQGHPAADSGKVEDAEAVSQEAC